MSKTMRGALAALLAFAAIGTGALAGEPKSKFEIVVESTAKADGRVTVTVTPEGGAAKQVAVPVSAGMTEKQIAASMAAELTSALGEQFKVRNHSAVVVSVAGAERKAKFGLAVGSSTSAGVAFTIN